MPDWKRIAELTDEKRAVARDAKALILIAIREERELTEHERLRIQELQGAVNQLDDQLERPFYDDLPGT